MLRPYVFPCQRPYVFPCTFPRRMTDLKRSLRLADGLAMVVGMTVGAGIFRTPGLVAARLGRPGLTFVAWVLGAALAFLGALCFAELTTRQPRAAGKYVFVREAFGPRAGFVVGWVEALGTNGVAIAAIGVAAGEFLVRLSGRPPALIAPIGVGLVALFTGINLVGVASGRWVQNVVTAVTTFCSHRPDATPTRLIPVNSATSPTPIGAMSAGGRPESRTRNSPAATPIAAIATPLVPRASTQPTTKPARGPNASRTKTYLPAARGWRVVSSAKHSAPRNASAAPSTQATKVSPGRPSRAATSPGVRKIPAPTVIPTTMAKPSASRSERLRSVMRRGNVHGKT